MASYMHFRKREQELEYLKEQQGLLDKEIDKFITATNSVLSKDVAIELDSEKMNELQLNLRKLEADVLNYKERNHRLSRAKARHWERPALMGPIGDIRGLRRKINKKLERLLNRIRLIRDTVSSVQFSRKAVALEQTAKQLDHLVTKDHQGNWIGLQPGGEILMAVTFLWAFFATIVRNERDE